MPSNSVTLFIEARGVFASHRLLCVSFIERWHLALIHPHIRNEFPCNVAPVDMGARETVLDRSIVTILEDVSQEPA
ncbi:MAG: hypothetical protein HYV60_02580 [Planctomycetia bacterium]|nr:hypothetical protein [Planctomycetia bacterium]